MNILYFISSFSYGGAEKQTILDANMIGPDNNVFFAYFFDGPLKESLSKDVQQINLKKRNYLLTAIDLARILRENKIELIHCSLFAAMIIAALSGLCRKVKIIWHFHSHEYSLPLPHYLAFKWFARLPYVKKICFVNNELIQFYNKRGLNFPPKKIRLLYNNTTFHEFRKKETYSDIITIGYVGRVVTIKRVRYLIELAEDLVKKGLIIFRIQIIGDGDQRILLEQESEKKGLQKYISFEGFKKQVQNYYTGFDIFINPSQEECLSIALIDAGITGIPSIAFDVGGNNEIIIDSVTGYIVNNKKDMFNKVAALIKSASLRSQMSFKAIEHCSNNFSQKVHLQQLKDLYNEILE